MGKKSKPPAPPDPVATAKAQTESNLATARKEAELNRYDVNSPYGGVNWSQNGDRWTQTVTESPNQEQLRSLEEQQGIALGNLGLEQTGKVADILGSPYDPRRFDMDAATGGRLDIASALGDYGGDVEARTRELMSRGLDYQFGRAEEDLRSRLANQGINAGTDAFRDEMRGFNEGRGAAYTNAELAARGQAMADRQQMLSELLGQRATNVGEAQTQYGYDTTADLAARQNPLNEIIALLSGMQTNPINPGQGAMVGVSPTDYAGIINQGYQNQLGAYQARQQQSNGLLGGLASLGGAALGSPWLGGIFGGK